MYGNLLLTIGGTIQQIIENLQLVADERLIEPLWRMQVLVDRASRAQTDDEMDRFDDQLLQALSSLRSLRDQLAFASPATALAPTREVEEFRYSGSIHPAGIDGDSAANGVAIGTAAEGESVDEARAEIPLARYNGRRVTARLEATR